MRKFYHKFTELIATKKDGEGYYTVAAPDSTGGHVIDSRIIELGHDWIESKADKFKNDVSYAGSPEQLEEYIGKLKAGGMNSPGSLSRMNKAIRVVSFTDGSCGYRDNMNDCVYDKINFQSHQMEEALKAALEPGS
jgi:hypothetical protein